MKLIKKERLFKSAAVATDNDMESMFEEVKTVDSSIQPDSLCSKDLAKQKTIKRSWKLTVINQLLLFSCINACVTLVHTA